MSRRDGQLWAEFFLEHRRALTAYALTLAARPADAEDLIQDVLVRMVREQRPVHNARAYVFRCLRNLAIDRRRSAAARPDAAAAAAESSLFASEAVDAEHAEALAQLQAALDGLHPRQREVVAMKTYCELTFREIAEIVGEPLGTVTSRYRRGLEELRIACTRGAAHVP